ncbi:unnamed protein product, partial [Laminaria digitata]
KSRSPYESSSDMVGSSGGGRRRTGGVGAREASGQRSTERRSTSPSSRGNGVKRRPKAYFCREAELLPAVFAKLDSGDWRERVKGLEEVR